MSIYDRKRRFVYSLLVVGILSTIYGGFRIATDTFLQVERRETRHNNLGKRPDKSGNEAIQLARKWFGAESWVAESRKQFFDEGRYLFCREFKLIEEDRALKVEPIAVIWPTDDDKRPVTVEATSARLTSTKALSLNSTDLGQITGGSINGNVRIQGPDNLQIVGRKFQLDQDSMKLFSSEPVEFQYQTHSGIAPGGVDIYLAASADSEGGLLDVDHITQVQLHGQVQCNLFIPAKKPGREDVRLKIIAAGGFTFDVDMKTCTFSGLAREGRRRTASLVSASSNSTSTVTPEVELNHREEVWVRRYNDDGTHDELVCPELQLHLRNKIDRLTGKPIPDKLAIERLTAWGRSVEVASRANNLVMRGTELHYSLDEERFDLKHSDLDASGRKKMVLVIRDGVTLQVPHVRVLMSEERGFQRVECLGQGRLFGQIPRDSEQPETASNKPDEDSRFLVMWKNELAFRKLNVSTWLVQILGSASVQESSRKVGLQGDQIQIRLEQQSEDAEATLPGGRVLQVSHTASGRPPVLKGEFELKNLVPRLMTAVGNVKVSSPQGSGTVRDRLVVQINDRQPASTEGTPSSESNSGKGELDQKQSEEPSGITFGTDRLEAVLNRGRKSSPNQKLQLESVWLKGGVRIVRETSEPDKDFTAEGTMLHATGTNADDLDLQLFGDPARVIRASQNVEGPRIDLNKEATVVGSGRIRFYTDKGFDGSVLKKPAPLDIYWSDHMTFQQRSATFVGNIRIAMSDESTQDIEILCSGLKVYFSRDVTLSDSSEDGSYRAVDKETESEAGPIERIECQNKVTVSIDQFEADQQIARHRLEMVDLKMNMVSGAFTAIGPGFLESVSPDTDGTLQGSSPVSVRANSPAATSQTAFVYVKADFIGNIVGNLHDRMATLNQNVVALIAPARRVDEKISLDLLPVEDLPEKAGLLRAEQVTLSATSEDAFSLIARHNARLESQSLSASADIITYDHQKQQFIIRTEGSNDVSVVHRSVPGRPGNRLKGKRFEYYRRSNQLKADGIGGMQFAK